MQHPTPTSDLTNTPAQPHSESDADDIACFKRVLRHIVEIGDELAEMLRQEARGSTQAQAVSAKRNPDPELAAPIVVPPYLVESYDVVTRSIRRSLVIYQKLNTPQKARPVHDRVAARKQIIRDVEDRIHSKAPQDEQENLRAELVERLDRPEFDDELAHRTIAEIVTEISRDLGVAGLDSQPPWKRRTPHDIAILHARAAQPSGQPPSAELAALLGHQTTRRVARPDDS